MDGMIFQSKNLWLELHRRWETNEQGKKMTKELLYTNFPLLLQKVVGELWMGKPENAYLNLIQEQKYLPDVRETIHALRKKGFQTAIISGGMFELARRAQKELKIDFINANKLVFKNKKLDGVASIAIWHMIDEKGRILEELLKREKIDPSDAIVVGHDENDIPLFNSVKKSISLNPETERVATSAAKIVTGTIKDILPVIDEWI